MYFWKQIIESHKTCQDKFPPKIKHKEQINTIDTPEMLLVEKKGGIYIFFLTFFSLNRFSKIHCYISPKS